MGGGAPDGIFPIPDEGMDGIGGGIADGIDGGIEGGIEGIEGDIDCTDDGTGGGDAPIMVLPLV
jgi:hypothetical protein